MGDMRDRLLAVCCASVTLVAALFTAHVSYACSMTGSRQSHCCCAPKAAKGAEVPVTTIAGLCCERMIDASQAPAATQVRDGSLVLAGVPGPLLAVIPVPGAHRPQHVLPATVARGPPSGPPIYLRTCRFLI
jgi:hypothetical protein